MKPTTKRPDGQKSIRTRFLYVGGSLAVDFVNTGYPLLRGETALLDWEGFVEFLAGAKVISPARAGDLLAWRHSAAQALPALMKRALQLRSAIRSSLEARIAGAPVGEETAEAINEVLRITEGHDELVWANGDWQLRFCAREEAIEWLLAALARSAAELIGEGADAPVRKCANPACELFFYDTSRTRRRRWCTMTTCGNRSKVAAFARRHSRRRR
jgi:predicted RNA-binding Zn ribbon-like protein